MGAVLRQMSRSKGAGLMLAIPAAAVPPCSALNQLELRRFVCVLRKLGYRPQKAGQGSLRVFLSATLNHTQSHSANLIPVIPCGKQCYTTTSASSC